MTYRFVKLTLPLEHCCKMFMWVVVILYIFHDTLTCNVRWTEFLKFFDFRADIDNPYEALLYPRIGGSKIKASCTSFHQAYLYCLHISFVCHPWPCKRIWNEVTQSSTTIDRVFCTVYPSCLLCKQPPFTIFFFVQQVRWCTVARLFCRCVVGARILTRCHILLLDSACVCKSVLFGLMKLFWSL